MGAFGHLVAVIAAVTSLFQHADAHSQARDRLNNISRVQRAVIHTPSHRVHALSHFDLTFDLHPEAQRIKLQLEPNHDAVAQDAQVTYLDVDGNIDRVERLDRRDHRVFKGWAWVQDESRTWTMVGWARIMMHKDGVEPLFEGVFTVMHDHHQIIPKSKYLSKRHPHDPQLDGTPGEHMLLFRGSDIRAPDNVARSVPSPSPASCDADTLTYGSKFEHMFPPLTQDYNAGLWGSLMTGISRRQNTDSGGTVPGSSNLRSTIGNTAGCPDTRRVALIGVVADCTYTQTFVSEMDAKKDIISVVNAASVVYEHTFNISLTLGEVNILPKDCPSTASSATPFNVGCDERVGVNSFTLADRLNTFSAWRGKKTDEFAFWTLMTDCTTENQVGLAWAAQLCAKGLQGDPNTRNASAQAVAGANVVSKTDNTWQVFAHEAGHIFGAVHDCDTALCRVPSNPDNSRCCPATATTCDADGKFMMNPTSGKQITSFSPCSVGQICSRMSQRTILTNCLTTNRGVDTISGRQCGNGIVEDGEDCDCGGAESCKGNKCCDPKTCKYTTGSQCDDTNEECCRGCKFAPSSTVCRPSGGPCDPDEMCSGNTGDCPHDAHSTNGQSCGNNVQCASGQCTSRDLQCQMHIGNQVAGNRTVAYESYGCEVACKDPARPNLRFEGSLTFIDGTPCGGGGLCQNGECVGGSFGNEVSDWVARHKAIVIGVSVGLGCLVLLAIASCIFKRNKRSRPRNRKMAPLNLGPMPPVYHGWSGPAPPGSHQQQQYQDRHSYNMPPIHSPPPAYPGRYA
uniref:Disintegrin and metalloproteinase domain-containing protein B n=1 Tax=Onygena corvina TaxID=180788 RepID=A0A0B4VLZ4_9EURO|nr:zinc metalloprotease mde10 [Onygena corvina]